jgi:hypothetical protein
VATEELDVMLHGYCIELDVMLHGYCIKCRKIKRVRVTVFRPGVQVGVCADCDRPQPKK